MRRKEMLFNPDFRILSSFVLIFFLPSFCFVSLNLSSLAAGLFLAVFCIVIIYIKEVICLTIKPIDAFILFGISLLVFAYAILGYFNSGETKGLQSISLIFLIFCGIFLGKIILNTTYQSFYSSITLVIVALFFLGWLKLFWQPSFLGYGTYSKPVFPFSEESHYALFLGTIACSIAFNAGYKRCLLCFMNMLVLALALPNLTLLVFSFLFAFVFFLRFRLRFLLVFSFLIIFVLAGILSMNVPGLEYFHNRLKFSESNILTTLVFIQGWQLAYTNLFETSGLGLGFQMLGTSISFLPLTSESIYRLTGAYFNITDGGFLAAKLIAEFGIVGALASLAYIWLLFNTAVFLNFTLRRVNRFSEIDYNSSKKLSWAAGIFFGFSVEFFLRGVGYFSPTIFLFVISLTVMQKERVRLKRMLDFSKKLKVPCSPDNF